MYGLVMGNGEKIEGTWMDNSWKTMDGMKWKKDGQKGCKIDGASAATGN